MNYKHLLIILLTPLQILSHGFLGTTLVKTPTGYTQMQYLKENDFIVAYDYEGHCVPRIILHKHSFIASECVMLKIETGPLLYVHPDHMFYDKEHDDWIKASKLKENDTILLKNCINPVRISFKDRHRAVFEDGFEFFDLTIGEYHNYCVTTEDVLVHNQWWGGFAARAGGYAAGFSFGPPHRGLSDAQKRSLQEILDSRGTLVAGGDKDPNDDWEWVFKYSERERREFKKSEKSFLKRAEEHRAKLEAYKKNPEAYDNKNHLKKAGKNTERYNNIYNRRIELLEGEIQGQLKKAGDAAAKAEELVLRKKGCGCQKK